MQKDRRLRAEQAAATGTAAVLGILAGGAALVAITGGTALPAAVAALSGAAGAGFGLAGGAIDRRLDDPPRFDYEQVFEISAASDFQNPIGSLQRYLEELVGAIDIYRQNHEGLLAAVERYQGAAIDNVPGAASDQLASFYTLDSLLPQSSHNAGVLLSSLPEQFEGLGGSDVNLSEIEDGDELAALLLELGFGDIDTLFSALIVLGDSLETEGLSDPVFSSVSFIADASEIPIPPAFLLFGLGIVGFAVNGRKL